MKARLPLIVQDPSSTATEKRIEHFDVVDDDVFLDGPVSPWVAVLDFEEHGALGPGVPFQPPRRGRVLGRYRLADDGDHLARDFNCVSVFATVLKTLRMFEEDDALGRRVRWAFEGPQLLVVPRAGLGANAAYTRASRSLQFFYFQSPLPQHQGRTIFTSLSQDIVSHETGHAILDGIAPDLYHALTPQAQALHEAIADLTALVMAFRTRTLTRAALKATGGSIRDAQAFSALAEEFGAARDPLAGVGFLRNFDNQKTLDPEDRSRDRHGRRNRVSRTRPHELSEVLTGALYPTMLALFEHHRAEEQARSGRSAFSASGKALAVAADRFKRLVFRALDYLPPGEVSFADYARAVLAADQAGHPGEDPIRTALADELVRRHVVGDVAALEVRTDFAHDAVEGLDLERLVSSDWAAYDFAERNRALLGIPEGVHFRVRPRLDVTKRYYTEAGPRAVRECILKVSWDARERNDAGQALPAARQITVGTTLALTWDQRPPRVRALLHADAGRAEGPALAEQRRDRDAMLARLIDERRLTADGETPRAGALRIETHEGLMRVRNLASMLHAAPAAPAARSTAGSARPMPPPGVDATAFFDLVRKRRG